MASVKKICSLVSVMHKNDVCTIFYNLSLQFDPDPDLFFHFCRNCILVLNITQ